MDSRRDFQVTLWGATGYTGRLASGYLAQTANFKWAIAGRSRSKLESLAADLRIKHKLDNIPICVANNEDEIIQMTRNTKVLISMAGPFWLCGEQIVSACVKTGTHYLDITAELPWVEDMKRKYSEEAEKAQVKLIPCCGFDFVPNDMMMFQLLKVMEAERPELVPINSSLSVTQYFHQSTPMVSGGTAYSGMELMSRKGLGELLAYFVDPYAMCYHKRASDKVPPYIEHQNVLQILPVYSPEVNAYCVPYVMTSLMHKYMHWSNETQGYPWGPKLVYLGGEYRPNIIIAYFFAFFLWVEFILFGIISHCNRSIWYYVLPSKGNGPAIDPSTAFAESQLVAQGGGLKDDESILIKWRLDKGEAYMLAGMFAVEAAKCLAISLDECPSTFGVVTPSGGLGEVYLERLLTIRGLQVTSKLIKQNT